MSLKQKVITASLAAEGITTGAGNVGGTTFIDSGLIGVGADSYISMLAILYPGQPTLVDSSDITAFNSGTGQVTINKAYKGGQIGAGVPYKIVAFRFVPAEVAALTSMAQDIDYGDSIHYDSAGSPGTSWPIGTVTNPCSSLADVRTIAAALSIKKIVVHSSLTLDAAMEGYEFIGLDPLDAAKYIDLNSKSVDNSVFRNLYIKGAMGGTGYDPWFVDCVLGGVTAWKGWVVNGVFTGDGITIAAGAEVVFWNASSLWGYENLFVGAPSNAYLHGFKGDLNVEDQTGGWLTIFGAQGHIHVISMTGGTLDIYGSGSIVELDASDLSGTVNIYGNAKVTDTSNPLCTVNDYTVETKVDAISALANVLDITNFKQETVAATDANGTNWVDLLDKSTITKPTKICGFKVTVSAGWAGKARLRITDGAGTTKIFPFEDYLEQDAATGFASGAQETFNFPVVVPVADGYKVQFCSSAAGDVGAGFDVTLNNLDVIEVG